MNAVPGAIQIQNEIERIEWAQESADPTAYAPHLRAAPLRGVPVKRVLFSFAQGDPVIRNTTTGNILRAGGLADRTLYFRGLDAYAAHGTTPTAPQLHEFLFQLTPGSVGILCALPAQDAVAAFLASDGTTMLNPDGACPFFETPIQGPLP